MHFFMHEILIYKFVVNELSFAVRKTRPPLVTVAMPDIQCRSHTTRSHAVKNTSQSKEETDKTPTEKTEQVTSGMKQGLRTLSF